MLEEITNIFKENTNLQYTCRKCVEFINKNINARITSLFFLSKIDGNYKKIAEYGEKNNLNKDESYSKDNHIINEMMNFFNFNEGYFNIKIFDNVGKFNLRNKQNIRVFKKAFGRNSKTIYIPFHDNYVPFGFIKVVDKINSEGKIIDFNDDDFGKLVFYCNNISWYISQVKRKSELVAIKEISKLIRYEDTKLKDFCSEVAKILISDWTDFIACCIRIVKSKEKNELELLGYAYDSCISDTNKFKSAISINQGIVGEVFKEKTHKFISNISDPDIRHKIIDINWMELNGIKSFICYPIRSKDKIIGTLSLFTRFQYDCKLLNIEFIDSLCCLIEKANDFYAFSTKRKKISNFVESSLKPLDEGNLFYEKDQLNILYQILYAGTELIQADIGFIALVNPRSNLIEPKVCTFNIKKENIPVLTIEGNSLTSEVINGGKSINCQNVRSDDNCDNFIDYLGDWAGKIKSELIVPMKYEDNPIGVIEVASERSNEFSSDDKVYLETLANQAALIFQKQRFYESANKLANLRFSLNDRQLTYSEIVKTVVEISDFNLAMIFLIDAENNNFLKLVDYEPKKDYNLGNFSKYIIPINKSLSGLTISENSEKIYYDIVDNPEIYLIDFVKKYKFNTLFSIPLYISNDDTKEEIKEIGVLNLLSKRKYKFFNTQLNLIRAFAISVSHAINIMNLIDELKEVNVSASTLASRINTSGMITGAYHTMSKIFSDILTVKHDIQISIEKNYKDILRDKEFKGKLQLFYDLTDDLKFYYNKIDSYEQGRNIKPKFTINNINEIIKEVLKFLSFKLRKQKIEVNTDLKVLQVIICDNELIFEAIYNIIVNSIDATKEKGKLFVGTEMYDNNNFVRIRITDTGSGFGKELNSKIFKPFFTTKSNGTGMGLPFSKQIIEELHKGGKIDFISEKGKGTTFYIYLPNKQY